MQKAKQSAPGVSFKAFRSKDSWKNIIQSALKWMNASINLNRIISISTVYCHANDQGLVTVYFVENQASPQHHSSTIEAELIRDTETWANHSKIVAQKVAEISSKCCVVLTINDLEINSGHQQGFTVIWYLKPNTSS